MAVEYHILTGIASAVGLAFALRLALVLGGLGFASVFAVALLVGGIYLIATGHPTGG